MNLLDTLERHLGRFAIPNITLGLVIGQAITWIFVQDNPHLYERLAFIPALVGKGEVWRIFTFLIMPPAASLLFVFFALYLLYFMGTALEAHWGTFRYNLYILVGAAANMAAACLVPDEPATNAFVSLSIFLAFAWLYPDYELLLFFILPIRIKWLALIAWLGLGGGLFVGDWLTRVLVLATVFNFLLFFAGDMVRTFRASRRQLNLRGETLAQRAQPLHVCRICGVSDQSDRKMEFRYCPNCAGTPCYCINHIHSHEHTTAAQ